MPPTTPPDKPESQQPSPRATRQISIDERLSRIELLQEQEWTRQSRVFWIANLLQGLTLLSLLGFAF